MDTSEQYIKMCEKAEGVQNAWKELTQADAWDCSDFVYDKHNKCSYCLGGEAGLVARDFPKYFIWLPRQDQLQEMITGAFEACRTDDGEYSCLTWNAEGEQIFSGYCESMEQAMLLAVMEQKFSKNWDGEDWLETTQNLNLCTLA